MELLKFYFLVLLLVACVVAHSSDSINKLKPGQKNKNKANDASKPVLNRSRRQFGGFGGGSFSNANANAGSFSSGFGSPYGGFPYGGGGFGGSNSFASANAASGSFGGR